MGSYYTCTEIETIQFRECAFHRVGCSVVQCNTVTIIAYVEGDRISPQPHQMSAVRSAGAARIV